MIKNSKKVSTVAALSQRVKYCSIALFSFSCSRNVALSLASSSPTKENISVRASSPIHKTHNQRSPFQFSLGSCRLLNPPTLNPSPFATNFPNRIFTQSHLHTIGPTIIAATSTGLIASASYHPNPQSQFPFPESFLFSFSFSFSYFLRSLSFSSSFSFTTYSLP